MLSLSRLKLVTNIASQAKSPPSYPAISHLASPMKGKQDKFIKSNTAPPPVKFLSVPSAFKFGQKAFSAEAGPSSEMKITPSKEIAENFVSDIRRNNIPEVKNYINSGYNLDFLDFINWAPLHTAALFGHTEIIKLLAKAGADIHVKAPELRDSATPLFQGVKDNRLDTVKTLLRLGAGSDINLLYGPSWQSLQHSCYAGHSKMAKLLMDAGAEIDYSQKQISDSNLKSPLHMVVGQGQKEIFEMLLKQGANLFISLPGLGKPSEFARRGGDPYFIKPLEEAEKQINTFKSAVQAGNLEHLKMLLKEHERLPMGVDAKGNTLLHLAAQRGNGPIVKWLIEQDVKLFKENLNGETPLAVLSSKVYSNLVPVLKQAEEKAMLIHSFLHADMERLHEFVQNGGDISQTIDSKGNTLLHLGASKGYYYSQWLVEEGVSSHQKNSDGLSPIALALEKGYEDLIPIFEQGERNAVDNLINRDNKPKLKELMENSGQPLSQLFSEVGSQDARYPKPGDVRYLGANLVSKPFNILLNYEKMPSS